MREIRPYHPTFDVMRYLEVHYKARPLPMPDPSDRQDIATLLGLNIPKEEAPLTTPGAEHQATQKDVSGESSGA